MERNAEGYRIQLVALLREFGGKIPAGLLEETPSHDNGDVARANAEKENIAGWTRVRYGNAKLVQAALDRIKDGTFGICLACEEPINKKRLDAIPYAPICISCQEQVNAGQIPELAYLRTPEIAHFRGTALGN
jgi:RNA polymerase-binding transcription factor DksA